MLLGLFESLRAEKVPVTLREWLDLMGALDADLAFADLDAFFHLARLGAFHYADGARDLAEWTRRIQPASLR